MEKSSRCVQIGTGHSTVTIENEYTEYRYFPQIPITIYKAGLRLIGALPYDMLYSAKITLPEHCLINNAQWMNSLQLHTIRGTSSGCAHATKASSALLSSDMGCALSDCTPLRLALTMNIRPAGKNV